MQILKLSKGTLLLSAVIFCLLIFSGARGEGGLYLFRIRPQVEQADRETESGAFHLGTGRNGTQHTARLRVGTEGRTREGEEAELCSLLREYGGTVLEARWRVEFREPGTLLTRWKLVPEDGGQDLRLNATEGMNLWDLTDWVRAALEEGKEFSFTLGGAKKAGTNEAEADLSSGWIHVVLRLEKSPDGLEKFHVTDSELLDFAFAALPEGHWALQQYREVSGSLTRPLWPETGVPYYFGGHSEEKVMTRRFFPQQESVYYKKDRLYLCGFDCGSYLHWVEEKAGCSPHDSLSTLVRQRGELFPLKGRKLEEWCRVLDPGDLLIFQHGTMHVGMYIGTPRMLGLTAASAPELAEYLDLPMMLHCGEDPFCYDRFRAYIESRDFRLDTSPPDGGVTVSMLLPEKQDAPHLRETPWGKEYGYFSVLDQTMTVFDMSGVEEMAWYRPVPAEGIV